MRYNPDIRSSRVHLATILIDTLRNADFLEESNTGSTTKERVYYRLIDDLPSFRIRVFTTVVGDEVRDVGKDAIRVCTVYRTKEGKERGVGSEIRVNRTGDTDEIASRMLSRMRKAWVDAHADVPRCSCGAPKFKSRNGNLVCADLCWKK